MKTKPNSFISLQINKMSLKSKLIGIAALATVAGACEKEPTVEPVDETVAKTIRIIENTFKANPNWISSQPEGLYVATKLFNTAIQDSLNDNTIVLDSLEIDGARFASKDYIPNADLATVGVSNTWKKPVGISTNQTNGAAEDARGIVGY